KPVPSRPAGDASCRGVDASRRGLALAALDEGLHPLPSVGTGAEVLPALREGRCGDQILPTRSSEGAMDLAPSFHLAGHTWPGLAATNWAALSLRKVSLTSRAIALSWTSRVLITPSGLMMKVPRRARPSSSMCTPKARVS